jgi:hypothetical protein
MFGVLMALRVKKELGPLRHKKMPVALRMVDLSPAKSASV